MPISPHQQYVDWIEDRIEEFKNSLTRDELMQLADEAVDNLFGTEDGQYPLTEILLRDAVDSLIFHRLKLPTYRQWLKTCQSDTESRPLERTVDDGRDGLQAS